MEETRMSQESLANGRLVYLVNRDTGEIWLLDHYFCLDFESNIVFKLDNNYITPVCFGRFDGGRWHFRGLGVMISHEDRLVAALKALYYAFKNEVTKPKAKGK